MSNALYGGKILISETGSPIKIDEKIEKDDSILNHGGASKVEDDEALDLETATEYTNAPDDEDGEDDLEAPEGIYKTFIIYSSLAAFSKKKQTYECCQI